MSDVLIRFTLTKEGRFNCEADPQLTGPLIAELLREVAERFEDGRMERRVIR